MFARVTTVDVQPSSADQVSSIYQSSIVPDIKASTAGIHIANVLAQLGIAEEVAMRLKIHPNGATAMRELAASRAKRPIGCTQSTEIIATKGVELSGSLPKGCDLATTYTAGVTTSAAHASEAPALIK